MAAQLLGTGGVAILLLLAVVDRNVRYHRCCIDVGPVCRFRRSGVRPKRRYGERGSSDHERRMSIALDIFTIAAVLSGALFFSAGTVGLLRFPDSLTRLHALTKVDNLGLGLIVLGLLPQTNGVLGALKLVSIWLLVQLSGSIVTQLIAGAVRENGPRR